MKVTIEMTLDEFNRYVTRNLGATRHKSEIELLVSEGYDGKNILALPILFIEANQRK